MGIKTLRDALLGVHADVYHYIAPQKKAAPYIVWGETAVTHAEDADDEAQIVLASGELWYYTEAEYDGTVSEIIRAIESAGATWRIQNIGRETDTGLIVYGFSWGLPCGYSEIY